MESEESRPRFYDRNGACQCVNFNLGPVRVHDRDFGALPLRAHCHQPMTCLKNLGTLHIPGLWPPSDSRGRYPPVTFSSPFRLAC